MRSPRDSSKAPMAAAATPLPNEDSTPPVIKMILLFTSPLLYPAKANVKVKSGGRRRGKRRVIQSRDSPADRWGPGGPSISYRFNNKRGSVEIQVVLLQGEDCGLIPITALEIRLPFLKITLAPPVLRGHLLPAAAFPTLGQEFSRLDFRGHLPHHRPPTPWPPPVGGWPGDRKSPAPPPGRRQWRRTARR
jgi:hypothetical protein